MMLDSTTYVNYSRLLRSRASRNPYPQVSSIWALLINCHVYTVCNDTEQRTGRTFHLERIVAIVRIFRCIGIVGTMDTEWIAIYRIHLVSPFLRPDNILVNRTAVAPSLTKPLHDFRAFGRRVN